MSSDKITGNMQEAMLDMIAYRDEDSMITAADLGTSFVISGFLAANFKTLLAPFERIKLILQTQANSDQMVRANKVAYNGFLDALVRIPKEQGFFSLWRGNFLNISRYFPAQAINFSLYELYYATFVEVVKPATKTVTDIISFVTGGVVGVTSCMILYPLTFCSTRIAVDVGDGKLIKREFCSLNHCLTKIYRRDGYRGFYQGLPSSAMGVFLYRSLYFGLYTSGKRTYLHREPIDRTSPPVANLVPIHVSFCIAQFASTTATLVSYPFDTIARQTMLSSGQGVPQHVIMRETTNRILKKEGVIGLYRGIFANLVAAVSGSLILVTYDIVKGYYRRREKAEVLEVFAIDD